MKQLAFFLILFTLTPSLYAQNPSLRELLTRHPGKVTDTVFNLKTTENVTADIPATLITGRQKGPTMTIIAGMNGTEYPAIQSLLQLRKEINPEQLNGNLILIPVLSMESFFSRVSGSDPRDKQDLNRAFPGSPTGTITEVIADFITTRIFDATDIFIELHGTDGTKSMLPFISYYDNKEFIMQTRLASALCESSGFHTIVRYPYDLLSGQPALYAGKQAVRLGIPALSLHMGKVPAGQKTKLPSPSTALYNILQELKMHNTLKSKRAQTTKNHYGGQSYVLSPGKGFFRSSYKPGQKVQLDEEIGYITDVFGSTVRIITAPGNGTILSKITTLAVRKGETLFFIGF